MRCEGVPKRFPPLLEVQYGSKPESLLKRVYLAFAKKALHVRPRGHRHDTLRLDLQRRVQIRQGVLLVACMRCRFAQRRRVGRKVGGSSGSEQLDGMSIKLLGWQTETWQAQIRAATPRQCNSTTRFHTGCVNGEV